ncbi:hypothetical protein VXM60_09990 [Shewanella khirikhana]|uniref:hypothetical protein n=1 Tax=Shewanella khirikhana TaxID=1965282 RepID=UPI0030D59D13
MYITHASQQADSLRKRVVSNPAKAIMRCPNALLKFPDSRFLNQVKVPQISLFVSLKDNV